MVSLFDAKEFVYRNKYSTFNSVYIQIVMKKYCLLYIQNGSG